MSIVLRVILIVMSLILAFVIIRKIRQAKAKIEDAMFWVLFSLLLILFSVIPQAADFVSGLVGTMSTANFIFLLIIFLILVKSFSMAMKISQLETKVNDLVQRIAIDANEKDKQSGECLKNEDEK